MRIFFKFLNAILISWGFQVVKKPNRQQRQAFINKIYSKEKIPD